MADITSTHIASSSDALDHLSIQELAELYCRRVLTDVLSRPDAGAMLASPKERSRLHPAARIVLNYAVKGIRIGMKPRQTASGPLPDHAQTNTLPLPEAAAILMDEPASVGTETQSANVSADLYAMARQFLNEADGEAVFMPLMQNPTGGSLPSNTGLMLPARQSPMPPWLTHGKGKRKRK